MIPRTKVFVGSLPQNTKPEDLRRLFENYGVVTECDVMNRCGFVHMQSPDMAENAIQALNNTLFNGAMIVVEHGRMKERNIGGNGGGQVGGNRGRGSQGGFRGGNMGGGGPIRGRNENRGGNRNQPYQSGNRSMGAGNRNQGGNDYQRRGGNSQRNDGMGLGNDIPQSDNRMGGGYGGGNSRFSDDTSYGFSNEDRRGFALPSYPSQGVPQNGNSSYGGNDRGYGQVNADRGYGGSDRSASGNMYDRRPPPQGNMGEGADMFSRRGSSGGMGGGRGGINNKRGGFGGGQRGGQRGGQTGSTPRGGAQGNYQQDSYNQQFPPLNAPGAGMNNRNQGPPPPRRDMMANRRQF